jgi:hypothetical protein
MQRKPHWDSFPAWASNRDRKCRSFRETNFRSKIGNPSFHMTTKKCKLGLPIFTKKELPGKYNTEFLDFAVKNVVSLNTAIHAVLAG